MSIDEEHFEIILMNIKNILSFLPKINYITLKHLIYHLHLISSFSQINMMDSNNLSLVFAPTLFNLDLQQLMDTKNYAIKTVKIMIEHYEEIFVSKDKISDGSYLEPSEYQRPMIKCPEQFLKKLNERKEKENDIKNEEKENNESNERKENKEEEREQIEINENKQND